MASSTEKKLALVTGSTSGIGESIAYALASKGMDIVVNGFGTEEQIRAVQKECQSRGAQHVEYCSADLMDARQIEAMFSEVEEKFGKTPDVLVNNAGLQHVAPVDEFPPDKWDKMIALNLSASFHTTRLSVPGMKERGWGRIINIASTHGLVGCPNKAPYCASKFGVVGLTKAVALETAGTGITINAICPAYVLTPLTIPQAQAIADKRGCSLDEGKAILIEKMPTKEFVLPEQIGSMVVFLCSEDAKQITGSSLTIDGGYTA